MPKLTENTLVLEGTSGEEYAFQIYSPDTLFNAFGGIYVFSNRYLRENRYSHFLIYIGKTEDLSARFDNHHKQDCTIKNQANTICILFENSAKRQEQIETDLLLNYNTPCNEKNN